MKKHFVTFLSPGTFVSEQTTKEIDSWNVEKALEMAKSITERHDATPYGFQFFTRERLDNDLDSKVTETSGTYYIDVKIETYQEIADRNDPADSILLSNMRINGWDKVVVTRSSYWKGTYPLRDGDVVL